MNKSRTGSNRDKQRLVDSANSTICLSCRIILGNGNYANYDSNVKISFSLKSFAPPPGIVCPGKFRGAPPEKFLAAPLWKKS